jgi:hypothetical protein
MRSVIDGLIWTCFPLEAAVRAEVGLCLIACQDLHGELEVIEIIRFDEAGPESDQVLSDASVRLGLKGRCSGGRLWACFYPMPGPQHSAEERANLEQIIRSKHRNKLSGGII